MSPADSPFAQLPAPGPHPATAELRAYAAGTLPPAEEHRLEAHLLDCERCADLVEGFSMSDAPTTDRAVAQLHTRLQARIGAAEPGPVVMRWAWPRIAAAAALLAVVGGGIWGLQQAETPPATARHDAAPATRQTAPVAAVPQKLAAPPASTKPAPADYAAVAPPAAPRPARPRAPKPPAAQLPGNGGLANSTPRPPATSPAGRPVASAPAPAASATADMAATAPVLASASTPPAEMEEKAAAADTTATNREAKRELVVAADKKAKIAVADQAVARVRNTPMAAVVINPAPVGGTAAFRDHLRREAAEFEPEKGPSMNGNVRIKFTVGADGKVSDLKVTRGLREDYDAEALRIVCDGPAWQPGIAGGRRAPLPMEVSVPF
ncbi:energy transducer TonB [Hymenobacter ruricola]|uniref:Energy transducer TonB n=1 Tax=Hymenobacter ruricola TaxID=2791023 RepID=A0ABS0IAW5_9BACT|nr:energy transducer TonB [Hymenobacter ruricola]MBF9223896.1 energy transducer TonB [Hymenobacter ruricola]